MRKLQSPVKFVKIRRVSGRAIWSGGGVARRTRNRHRPPMKIIRPSRHPWRFPPFLDRDGEQLRRARRRLRP